MKPLPTGVTLYKSKYRAQLRISGKNKFLGLFNSPEQAFQVYKNHLRIKLLAQIKELQ